MSSLEEVRGLNERAGDVSVLSVYLPAFADRERDVGMLFEAGLSRLRLSLEQRPAAERAEFERAMQPVRAFLQREGGSRPTAAHAIFANSEALLHLEPLGDDTALIVDWRRGCLLAPLVGTLQQARPVVALLLDAGSATLHRFDRSGLHYRETFQAGEHDVPTQRARFLCTAALRAALLAGPAGWCVIAGDEDAVRDLLSCLPNGMISRVQLVSGLSGSSDVSEVRDACMAAAADLSRHRDGLLVDRLLDRRPTNGSGAVGVTSVWQALDAGTVTELLITRRVIATDLDRAEALVRAALSAGAGIEVTEGAAADRLDAACEGVAARLRPPSTIASPRSAEAGAW